MTLTLELPYQKQQQVDNLRVALQEEIEDLILKWSKVVAELYTVTNQCEECGKTNPTYMLRAVGDVSREGKAQSTTYACKRHLTTIIDNTDGSVVVRKT